MVAIDNPPEWGSNYLREKLIQNRFKMIDFLLFVIFAVEMRSKSAREQAEHEVGLLENLLEYFVVHVVTLVLIVFCVFASLSLGRNVYCL